MEIQRKFTDNIGYNWQKRINAALVQNDEKIFSSFCTSKEKAAPRSDREAVENVAKMLVLMEFLDVTNVISYGSINALVSQCD